MEVAAVAGQVGERLGHERGEHPALLRHRVHHVAEEDRAIGGGQRVGKGEVRLKLPVGVLMIVGIRTPAQLVDVAREGGEEVVLAGEAFHVVAGLRQVVERVGQLDAAVCGLAQQEELEFHPDLEGVAEALCPLQLSPQDRARTVGPLLAEHRDVTGKPGEPGLERDRGVGREIGYGHHVGRGRRLADRPGREARESGALLDQPIPIRDRHQLRRRLRIHVHELGEDELDVVLLRGFANALSLVHPVVLCHCHCTLLHLVANAGRRLYTIDLRSRK